MALIPDLAINWFYKCCFSVGLSKVRLPEQNEGRRLQKAKQDKQFTDTNMKTIQTAILAILAILAAPALLASPWFRVKGVVVIMAVTDLIKLELAASSRSTQTSAFQITPLPPGTSRTLADNPNGLAIPSFQTFCVSSVTFNAGTTYDVAFSGITDQNYALTAGVAWLYSQFQWGILGGYDYTDKAGRLVSPARFRMRSGRLRVLE